MSSTLPGTMNFAGNIRFGTKYTKSIAASTASVASAHTARSWVNITMIAQPVMPFKMHSITILAMRPPTPENSEMSHAKNDGRYFAV